MNKRALTRSVCVWAIATVIAVGCKPKQNPKPAQEPQAKVGLNSERYPVGGILNGKRINEKFIGEVIEIQDGDLITVLCDKKQIEVRLESVDCPELKQAFGQEARQLTREICFNDLVQVLKTGEHPDGRTSGFVITSREKNVAHELLKAGLAWHIKKNSGHPYLVELESNAKTKKVGLWSDVNAVPPWEFRETKRITK